MRDNEVNLTQFVSRTEMEFGKVRVSQDKVMVKLNSIESTMESRTSKFTSIEMTSEKKNEEIGYIKEEYGNTDGVTGCKIRCLKLK